MARQPMNIQQTATPSLILNFSSVPLTDEEFYRLCGDNPDLRLELSARGELIVMPPAGSETGRRNSTLTQRLANWAESDGTGIAFDSSAGFALPNGAKRSPDASWVKRDRWEVLTREERERFAPLCPDFVVEFRSPGDSLSTLQDKMVEYIENGAQLGWLLDPFGKAVYVYRKGRPVERFDDPTSVSADPLLSGFVLNVREIW